MLWSTSLQRAVAALASVISMSSFGAQIFCVGRVNNTYVDAGGALVVKGTWRGDYTGLCNTRTIYNGIEPVTCLTWLSLLVTSQTKALDIVVSYNHVNAPACNSLPTYGSTPPPLYMILNTSSTF